jgi:hypothetical protein
LTTLNGKIEKRLMAFFVMAEREGFEPSIPCGMLAFQASALDHYATSPGLWSVSTADKSYRITMNKSSLHIQKPAGQKNRRSGSMK